MDNTFQVGICEFPDINASSFAIDKNGRYTLLAGRKGLLLVDLDPQTSDDSLNPDVSQPIPSNRNNSKLGPNVVKRIVRNSKYDPTATHFNRHVSDLFALTTYQIVDVYSVDDVNPMKPRLVLRGHSRTITDIEWSQFSPYMLGSSGTDCLTNLWDIRDSRRPCASLTTVAGATQVRFSKTSENLLATSHEIDVRIWDVRHPNIPVCYIAAHSQKINGMDWNFNKVSEQDQLITCSQDNTIKMWDIKDNKVKPIGNFSTKLPGWRIRYIPNTPNAIITSTLPQLRSRNECLTMKLWSLRPIKHEQKRLEPIFALSGHTDVIVDFDLRNKHGSNDVEIVSWSKDKTIRVWRIDHQIIELSVDNSDVEADRQDFGCDVDDEGQSSNQAKGSDHNLSKSIQSSRERQMSKAMSGQTKLGQSPRSSSMLNEKMDAKVSSNGSDIDDIGDNSSSENIISTSELKQEFNLLNKNIPNLEFEELNSLRRICLVTARAKSVICRLRIALPPSYPHTDCPTFSIIDDSNRYGGDSLPEEAKEKLLSCLDETAQSQLSRGRNCLEPCLRKFVAELQQLTSSMPLDRDRYSEGYSDHFKDDPITLSAQRDHSVPFPPTSGARFCGNLLVCFGRPIISTTTKQIPGEETGGANWLVETPRSMAQLSAQLDNMRRQGSYNLSNISISHFYYGAMRKSEHQNRNLNRNIYGSKYLSNRSKSILQAQSMSKIYRCAPVIVYDVSDLLGGLSRELAEDYVFDKDVIRMCRRNANVAAHHNRKDLVQIWSLAELSSEGMLNSYVARKDQQVGSKLSILNHNSDFGDRPWRLHPFGSKLIQSLINHYVNNCHDVQTAAMLVWTFSAPKANQKRTGYFHDDNYFTRELKEENELSVIEEGMIPKFNILSPEQALQNDLIMHVYAELLYRLNLLNQRALVLKNIGASSSYHDLFGSNIPNSPETKHEQSILLNLTNKCYNSSCNEQCRSVQCTKCKKYTLSCSICRLPVRGTCSVCMKCLHGGHVNHFDTWFGVNDYCPTGCGCQCLSIQWLE